MKNISLLFGVAVISFAGTYFLLPTKNVLIYIAATPGIAALFKALFQIIRDQNAHERNLEILQQQQIFNIGATSHMANVAFDKHVEFCEKYMKEVHTTSATLFSKGPTTQALDHASNFVQLRLEYAAWLTEEINENLFPFEQALRSLGAGKGFVDDTIGEEVYREDRLKKIKEVYAEFKTILSMETDGEHDENVAVEAVKRKVRKILDIEDLVQIRKTMIKQASKALDS